MKLIRAAILAAALATPSLAFGQSVVQLCTTAFNASTGAFSCIPVGQTSPNITAPNPLPVGGVANAAAPTFLEGRAAYFSFDLLGNARVTGSFTPSGTGDVNLTQVAGASVATGHGTAAGAIRVELPTDGTGVVGLNAGTAIVGKFGVDQTTPGTTNLVAAGQNGTWTIQPGNTANTTPWLTTNTPSSAAGAATTSASSTAAASNLVLKGSAGNLFNLTVTIGATSGYAMLFDATSLPSNGAVTPVWCYPIASNGTNGGVAIEFATPKPFGTGITAGFSTTGCFTLTASATGNFFGGYK